MAFQITPGNIDERKPVPTLAKNLWGRLFGDKGYISQDLFQELFDNNLKLVTPFKKNMNNKLVELWSKLMLRKRSLIETVNDQLQNISQLVHSRHRSVSNFMVNVIAGLIAYTWQVQEVRSRDVSRQNCQFTGGLNPPVTEDRSSFLAGVTEPNFSVQK